jgi:hypothetical protein
MAIGEIILVAHNEENMFLNNKPQISFFKMIYRRYTNFALESIRTNFLYQPKFGKKFSCEIPKTADLLSKIWLIIELPEIPIIKTIANRVDEKIKFAWAKKIGYVLIDYVEIEISGKTIQKKWGEYMNAIDYELNYSNHDGSLDSYIGNTPDFYKYRTTKDGVSSLELRIPLSFWFSESSTTALPLLCLEHNSVKFNVQLRDFESCANFSPNSFVPIKKYFGNGIFGEPLIQYSPQGIAWAEFDSVDVNTYNNATFNIESYNLYYRKISDLPFVTTIPEYYQNYLDNLSTLIFEKKKNYFIYGLTSGSIYVPIESDEDEPLSIYIEKIYQIKMATDLPLKNMYLLSEYIYLDREERNNFYKQKNQYLVEQIYFTGNMHLNNTVNLNYINLVNPCKWIIFMAQIGYFTNKNVNDWFNYNTTFVKNNNIFKNKPVIKNVTFSFNSNQANEVEEMDNYTKLIPFENFKLAKKSTGFGIKTFALHPNKDQPSGTFNMSAITSFSINTTFNPIDDNNTNYIFKTYGISYNNLIIVHGVAGVMFNNNI